MIKLSTINQIVEGIIAEGEAEWKIDVEPVVSKGLYTKDDHMADWYRIANEAVIYLKMAMICEDKGIKKAMDYYLGAHNEDEYQEFRTSMVMPKKPRPEHLKRMGVTIMEGKDE